MLWKQLEDFRSGMREWPVMNAVAKALAAEDLPAVAAFLSHVGPRRSECAPTRGAAPALVEQGDIKRLIPPCAACHDQRNTHDVQMFAPRIDGQRADYLERQLLLFRAGWRRNDIYGHMRVVARSLDDVEVRQLADWYASSGTGLACSP